MWNLIRRVLTTLGAYVGVLVLLLNEPSGRAVGHSSIVLATIVAMVGLADITWDIIDYIRSRPTIIHKSQAPAFLRKWIESGSRTAIFSRDMSWVDEPTKAVLDGKAQSGELIVVLPNAIPLSDNLRAQGAEVVNYPGINYVVRSRFTIINYERPGVRVAIGHELDDGKLRIEKLAGGDGHPALYMAQDLVELLRRSQAKSET